MHWVNLIGRCALAQIFFLAGVQKLTDYGGTLEYMRSAHVPAMLLPLVIALELGGGAALVIGWKARPAAALLALFCVLAALLFHAHFSDEVQTLLFLKNIAIAGGLAVLAERGAAAPSLDARAAVR
jgi:putative oxidoreductase